jgi:hypothetical protein
MKTKHCGLVNEALLAQPLRNLSITNRKHSGAYSVASSQWICSVSSELQESLLWTFRSYFAKQLKWDVVT